MKKKIRKFAEGGLNLQNLKALNLRDRATMNLNAQNALNLRDRAALNLDAQKGINLKHSYEMQNVPKTTTATEILPLNYVNMAGRGASPSARIEAQRQAGGYDTLDRIMAQRYVRRSRGVNPQYLDINTPNVDRNRYMVQDYQTGWKGTKTNTTYTPELVNVGERSLNLKNLKALQLKKGGKVTAKSKTKKVVKCTRGDGCAKRGKTKGRMV